MSSAFADRPRGRDGGGTLPSSPSVFIALGSNLGDSEAILEEAFARLATLSDHPLLRSSLHRTEPVDCPPGSPPFLNAAAGLVPSAGLTPEGLLALLQGWEREAGRRPKVVLNEARPLDLDIIAFGTEVRNTPLLTIPHPRATRRRFVLAPLAEIAPGLVLPGERRTVGEILRAWTQDAGAV